MTSPGYRGDPTDQWSFVPWGYDPRNLRPGITHTCARFIDGEPTKQGAFHLNHSEQIAVLFHDDVDSPTCRCFVDTAHQVKCEFATEVLASCDLHDLQPFNFCEELSYLNAEIVSSLVGHISDLIGN